MSAEIGVNDLRIVVMKNPFGLWSSPEAVPFMELFHGMIGLKLRGYGAEYPEGVLPVDTSDFIATHLLVCHQREGRLQPLTGFKSTLSSDCDLHRVSFPALGLVQSAEASPHIEYVKATMERCQAAGSRLAYTGSWTIEPELRKNRELAQILVGLFRATYIFHHLDAGVDEIFTGGTMRFKADVLLGRLGHDPLEIQGEKLPPIHVKHLFGEKVLLLHLRQFCEQAKASVEMYRRLWDERLILDGGLASDRKDSQRAA